MIYLSQIAVRLLKIEYNEILNHLIQTTKYKLHDKLQYNYSNYVFHYSEFFSNVNVPEVNEVIGGNRVNKISVCEFSCTFSLKVQVGNVKLVCTLYLFSLKKSFRADNTLSVWMNQF